MTITLFDLALILYICNISAALTCDIIEFIIHIYENHKKKKKFTEQKG